jgi:RND family efflux transporter MFP subunit
MKLLKKLTLIELIVAAVVVLGLGAGIFKALNKRATQQEAVAALANNKTESVIELGITDLVTVKVRDLTQGLPITGALRAADSALVKARVAGELQALSVREGDTVAAGQILARVDPTEYLARLNQAQEQASAAKAQIDIAQRQYDNNKALVNQGFISQTALATTEANLQSARATHLAARSAVDVAQKAVDDTTLRAPIAGQVSQRLAQPGERVAVEARVLEIVNLSRLELEAALSSADAASVRIGQTGSLRIEGLPQSVPARVVRISPSAQAGSRSVLVYLAVTPSEGLRNGLFAQGELATDKVSALSIPVSAVRTEKPEPFVQIVENGQVAHRAVQIGAAGRAEGESMVAVNGLAANTAVIRGPVGPLRAGTTVRLPTSTAPAAAAPASVPVKAGN